MPRIIVGIRVKPEIKSDVIKSFSHQKKEQKGGILEISANGSKHEFGFDHIFGEETGQAEVFDTCAVGVIDTVLDGFNGTLFAYGQTGAGKTHTGE
jgi:DNA replication protein DnaC